MYDAQHTVECPRLSHSSTPLKSPIRAQIHIPIHTLLYMRTNFEHDLRTTTVCALLSQSHFLIEPHHHNIVVQMRSTAMMRRRKIRLMTMQQFMERRHRCQVYSFCAESRVHSSCMKRVDAEFLSHFATVVAPLICDTSLTPGLGPCMHASSHPHPSPVANPRETRLIGAYYVHFLQKPTMTSRCCDASSFLIAGAKS